jgi:hypothetical protein
MSQVLRIGCGSGFWGDSASGAAQLVKSGQIDVLVLDYLAEITMSILARMRLKRPDAGYATDFVDDVMVPLAREIADRKIKVVANAGGVNPAGCRDALERALAKVGVSLKIAVVVGDDVTAEVEGLRAAGVVDLESAGPLPAAPLSANAYLGAQPIAEALRRGADVVITGRCVDSALTLGPLLAKFGWSASDWDKLAMGSLAGHVIECGCQATGGVFTDWHLVERDYADMGFPIVECAEDGTFILTKPEGTGGLVTPRTVAEQIVYEVHDPARYLLPDVICDFSRVHLEQAGEGRVRVTGARGLPAPRDFKASLTYADGFRCTATLMIVGNEARAKAERVGGAIVARVARLLAARGQAPFRETSIEVIGAESYFGAGSRARDTREVVLKIAAAHAEQQALELFAREIAPAATSMVQSITGFAGGRPAVQPILRLASCLIAKERVTASVLLDGESVEVAAVSDREPVMTAETANASTSHGVASVVTSPASPASPTSSAETRVVPLRWLAHGRSGDKGNIANIGILARRPEYVPLLRDALTPEVVLAFLAHLVRGPARRYEWPGLAGFNFVIEDALGGGGVVSLRHDPQGKALCQILLELPIRVSTSLALEAP